jgi:hypothetical protein
MRFIIAAAFLKGKRRQGGALIHHQDKNKTSLAAPIESGLEWKYSKTSNTNEVK